MSREEDLVRSTTQAIAATVSEVPPLRLARAAGQVGAPFPEVEPARQRGLTTGRLVRKGRPVFPGSSRRPATPSQPATPRAAGPDGPATRRGWRSWLVPAAAAVVVVALAIALVTIRQITNGGVASQPAPTVTGPGGVPRYYVAIRAVSAKPYAPNQLVVGDTVTGKVLAAFPARADTAFESVTAAADDRTFVVLDVAHPNPKDRGLGQADAWFEVKLAPGTATPVRLTKAPLEPVYGVVATALSASGRELAVATVDAAGSRRGISVYSLANGHLLHNWYTNDRANSVFWSLDASSAAGVTQWPALTWTDDDHTIAFTTRGQVPDESPRPGYPQNVRAINVIGPRDGGDLLAESRVIWSPGPPATKISQAACQNHLPLVSAGGKAVVCAATAVQPSPAAVAPAWMLTWTTFEETLTAAHHAVAYRVTVGVPGSSSAAVNYALWANATGSTIIGEWAVNALPVPAASLSASEGTASIPIVNPLSLGPAHFGVISHGKFTPLRLPVGGTVVAPQEIAW